VPDELALVEASITCSLVELAAVGATFDEDGIDVSMRDPIE
jgi:hypothetical protein